MKKGLCLLLGFLLLVTPITPLAERDDPGADILLTEGDPVTGELDKALIAENEGLALYVDETWGEFSIYNKADGSWWHSNPETREIDEDAKGVERTNLQSQLVIEYIDESKTTRSVNSKVGVLNKGGLRSTPIDGGVRLEYSFPKEGFVIPVEIRLLEDYLEIRLVNDQIWEVGGNKLLTISLMPFFGAAERDETGYLVVPDGCGAIADFSWAPQSMKGFNKAVYGEDPVLYKQAQAEVEQQVYMPVFGIKRESSMLGIIHEGDGSARISADIAGIRTSYHSASATFVYRELDTVFLQEMSMQERVINSVTAQRLQTPYCTVRYYFLTGDQADYIGMAAQYRQYLLETGKLEERTSAGTSLNLRYTATAEMKKSFLGIPYTGLVTLTDFTDMQRVLTTLKDNGVERAVLSLEGAFSGGVYGKIPNALALDGHVGRLDDYTKALHLAEEGGNALYLLTDFSRVYKSGNGVSGISGVARDVSGAISEQYTYHMNTFDKNYGGKIWKLLRPSALQSVASAFCTKVEGKGYGIGLLHTADLLYADYSRNAVVDRQQMQGVQTQVFEQLRQATGDLYYQGANVYAVRTAAFLADIPQQSSQYDMFTRDIPFYQAVLHGYLDYAGEPVNLTATVGSYEGMPHDSLLKAVEYGSAVSYSLLCQNTELVHKTTARDRFSSDDQLWLPRALETEQQLAAFYQAVAGETMIAHTECAPNVFRTVYANGYSTLVNYGDTEVAVGGCLVPAGGFCLLKDGDAQ